MKPFDFDMFGDIFGTNAYGALTEADIRARFERKDCASCNQEHADLRPWPPDDVIAHRFCGACRLKKALAL